MARSGGGAGTVVGTLTAAALVVVGFFTYQAGAAQDDHASGRPGAHGASPSPGRDDDGAGRQGGKGHGRGDGAGGGQGGQRTKRPTTPPVGSGHGKRIVYELRHHHVWLVSTAGKALRSFTVHPGNVSPRPGSYQVASRDRQVTGSDGVPVEHVVRFAVTRGTTIGFSAARSGSVSNSDSQRKTGGIRETRADGAKLWRFAPIGAKVVVLP